MTPRVKQHGNYFSADLQIRAEINTDVLRALKAQINAGRENGSHFFSGRYENLYIDRACIPEVESILSFARDCAASILRKNADQLQCGFWFNIMRGDDVTGRHSHDDNDEQLSAVYYINVPEDAGPLVLHTNNGKIRIAPVPGRLIFFDPTLEHEVIAARFSGERVSIGMNFGAAQ